MDLNAFKTDKIKEEEGVRVPLGDAMLLIARLNNPKHQADFAARIRPYRGAKIADDIQRELFIASLAEHVLIGWENVEMDGEPLPYSKENAKLALAITDFADFVVEQARNIDNFRAEQAASAVEDVAKN